MHTPLPNDSHADKQQFDERALAHVIDVTTRLAESYFEIAERVVNSTLGVERARVAIDALDGIAQTFTHVFADEEDNNE
jgi:hypothetical protein